MPNDAGLLVLRTTGVESEAEFPYAGLAELLRVLLARAEALPVAQRDALLTALGHAVGPAPEPFLVSLATLTLVTEAAADRPVLVAVDDVQWLDVPSHETLAFLARRVGHDPVVVVVAARTGHSGPIFQAGLPEMSVAPLDDDASRSLLLSRNDGLSHGAQERLLRHALGNPLALVELPRDATSGADHAMPLSARLVRAFASRIEELPSLTRDVLLVAAVDNVDDVPEILHAAGDLAGAPVALDAFEPATAARIVSFDEMRVSFRHPLVRSGVLQAESVVRRQAAHAALAHVIDGDDYRRAWHRAHAIDGPDDDLADELERTHRTALARGSTVGAIWALERAAQLTTDAERRARLLLLAAEQAFGLGRADLVDRLLVAAEQLPSATSTAFGWSGSARSSTTGCRATQVGCSNCARSLGVRPRRETTTSRSTCCSPPRCGVGGPTPGPALGPRSRASCTSSIVSMTTHAGSPRSRLPNPCWPRPR